MGLESPYHRHAQKTIRKRGESRGGQGKKRKNEANIGGHRGCRGENQKGVEPKGRDYNLARTCHACVKEK